MFAVASGKYYTYTYLRTMQNSQKPESSHLFVESATYGLYFVDSAQHDEIWKTTDEGVTVTKAHDNLADDIWALYYERTNERLYFADEAGDVGYLELSNSDNHVDLGNCGVAAGNAGAMDLIFASDGTGYVFIVHDNGTTLDINVYIYESPTWDLQDTYATGIDNANPGYISYVTQISTSYYFIWQSDGADADLMKYTDIGGIVKLQDIANTALALSNYSMRGITYDESDWLTFVLNDDNTSPQTGTWYYYKYQISTDTLTKGTEYPVSVMLNRNTNISNDPPFNLEKAFHLTSYLVYQISRNKSPAYIVEVANLNGADTPPTNAIITVSDTYLITDGAKLYKFKELSVNFREIIIKNRLYWYNKAKYLETDEIIYSDLVLRIYDSQTPPALLFKGKIHKEYDDGVIKEYKGNGLEKADLDGIYTETNHSAKTLDYIAKDIFNDGQFTYADATSCPAIVGNHDLNFVNYTRKDALDVLKYLGNTLWYVEPDGKGYFRVNTGLVSSGITITQATGGFSAPEVRRKWDPVNYVHIFGGINPATGKRFESTSQDAESILLNGRREWDKEINFPCCETQAELDLVSAGILAYKGVGDNPTDILINIISEQDQIQSGESLSLQFTHLTALASATDYPIRKVLMDVIANSAMILIGNNLTEDDLG